MTPNARIYLRAPIGTAIWATALSEAQRLFHAYVGVEHVMIALTRAKGGYTERMLERLGLEAQQLRAALRRRAIPGSPEDYVGFRSVITPRLREALLAAQASAQSEIGGARSAPGNADGGEGDGEEGTGEAQRFTLPARDSELGAFGRGGGVVEVTQASATQQERALGERAFLLAVLSAGPGVPVRVLSEGGRAIEELLSDIQADSGPEATVLDLPHMEVRFGGGALRGVGGHAPPSLTGTPMLDRFGRDLTALAHQGKLRPVIGRKETLNEIARTLLQLERNTPVLVGEAGVGKTAIVEGFAVRLSDEAQRQVVPGLQGKRIVELQVSELVAGAGVRGEFEERLHAVLRECAAHPEVILFLDEIHTLVGAGHSSGTQDAAQIVKPALGRGDLRVIGATTPDEFHHYIERDPALARRMQRITVEEPSVAEAEELLEALRPRWEQTHHVQISPKAIQEAIDLSVRYFPEQRLPAKAIDLLDAACTQIAAPTLTLHPLLAQLPAEVSTQVVTPETVAAVVAKRMGVPVGQIIEDEQVRLLTLEATLRKRVRAQNEALHALSESLILSRSMVGSPKRPRGVLLFAGPTGVGKTETARALAEALYGPVVEQHFLQINMAELNQEHMVSQLIGSPPGYVGYDREGRLTGWLRRHPYSVVLFDEFEKAHPEVRKSLLSLLEEGRLTDGSGQLVNGKQAIYILTTNLLADGATTLSEAAEREDLAKELSPELVNRLDRVVRFRPLSREALESIAQIAIDRLRERLKEREVELEVGAAVRARLVDLGSDPASGARQLGREVERRLGAPLAELEMRGKLTPGTRVQAELEDDVLQVSVVP